jgi:voltage-gated potassium channel
MALRLETYAPEDEIVREGEVGEKICFISQGKAEITTNEGGIVHGTLEDGDYFGDLSLILGEKRTASVKALTYCEIFILIKEDFNGIKDKYPEIREVLKKMSSEKTDKIAALVLKGITL